MATIVGKSDWYENALLQFIFNQTIVAEATGLFGTPGSPLGSLYVSLHTAALDETVADQTSNEITYTSYARVAMTRSNSVWSVSGNQVTPVANIDFPTCTATFSGTATHFAVGTAASGAGGEVLYSGSISPTIPVANGTLPRLTTATVISED